MYLGFLFKKCCDRTLPVAWDDPTDCENLNDILIDTFNQAGRGTLTKCVEVPTTIPLVTINEENLRSSLRLVDCANSQLKHTICPFVRELSGTIILEFGVPNNIF